MFLRRNSISQLAKNYLNICTLAERNKLVFRNDVHLFSTSTAAVECRSSSGGNSGAAVAPTAVTGAPEEEVDLVKKLRATFDDEIKDDGIVPPFKRALLYGSKTAVKDTKGEVSYGRLFLAAKTLAIKISNICGSATKSRVCYLCSNDRLYIVAQWASWFSGHTAVPLSARHPPELLEYYIKDCEANLLICSAELEAVLAPIAKKLDKPILFIDQDVVPEPDPDNGSVIKSENVVQLNQKLIIEGAPDSKYYANSNAIILYTSGTTGRPKGVVLSHRNLDAQVTSISNAWQIDDKDCVLHVLPLHHFHGVVNGLACPLNAGSKVIMLPSFESSSVWTYLLNVNLPMRDRISVFMAVPTIYALLIQEYDKIFASNLQMADYIKSHCKNKIRLMISGSAPLPETIFNKWESITGHKLLERYGMTEIGMGLSNPYIQDQTRERRPGTVGGPLPFVEVKITETGNPNKVLVQQKGELDAGLWSKSDSPVFSSSTKSAKTGGSDEEPIIGDLFVRGKTVFSEYYKRPEDTQKEFIDGWFKTGDTAAFVNGYFKILGRSSVDIIKSGGHKLSALEIESKLLEHPSIQDIAIVALPDETWGSKVAALVVLRENTTLEVAELKEWASQKLAAYAIPTVIKFVEYIPKNAMGKVNKKDLMRNAFVEATAEPAASASETTKNPTETK